MPLVVFCGLPSARKSDAVEALVRYFEEVACVSSPVHVVREAEFVSDPKLRRGMRVYLDSRAERELRGKVKAEVLRLVGRDRLVVLDGINYVKGFRYELYCVSKAARTTQCTVFADSSFRQRHPSSSSSSSSTLTSLRDRRDEDLDHHEDDRLDRRYHHEEEEEEVPGYDPDVLRMLRQRLEVPDGKNRWDAPLFQFDASNRHDDGGDREVKLPFEAIRGCLYDRAPPPPNKSTESQPLSTTDYLQRLDAVTRSVLENVAAVQRLNPSLDVLEVTVPGVSEKLRLPSSKATAPALARLRRQYITFSKTNRVGSYGGGGAGDSDSEAKMKTLFVQYLNSNFGDDV